MPFWVRHNHKRRKVSMKFFREKPPVVVVRQPVEVHLSEYNNLWNQAVLELARPDLCPGAQVDWEKIRRLDEEMAKLRREGKH